jgi:hypothetical protein
MTAPDLTRADARKAIEQTKRALGGLNHLAIAGAAHADQMSMSTMTRLTTAHGAILELINVLGQSALQLPEEET